MRLNCSSPADEGILLALKDSTIHKSGSAVELGAGTARNLSACAMAGYKSTGYDIAPWFVTRTNRSFKRRHIPAEILECDVQTLKFAENSLSVAILGTPIYWPKSVLSDYLERLWCALTIGGILHLEFATLRDGNTTSDFCIYTCFPFPEDGFENSYGHYCGCNCAYDHPGVLGASFWEDDEPLEFLRRFGTWRFIHKELREWSQFRGQGEPRLPRSFELVTIQKI